MNRPLESELHQFADGELDRQRADEIKAWLEQHPAESERVFAWQAQKEALRSAFGEIEDAPVPDRLRHAVLIHSRRRFGRLLAVAASVACLVVGGIGGYFLHDVLPESPAAIAMRDLPRDAAIAHALYTPEVRHPVEVGAEQEAHLVQWLSKRLGHPLIVPNLHSSGFELVGGRLLPSETGPVAQLMYQNTAGLRLTLYLRHGPHNGETGFRFARENDMSVFYWLDDSLGCALTGDLPRENLLAIAQDVYGQIVPNG